MKRLLFVSFVILPVLCGCASSKNATVHGSTHASNTTTVREEAPQRSKFAEQSTWVLGYFTLDRIKREPHSEWFTKEYNDYRFNSESVDVLMGMPKDDLTIKVVLGTWCPDSHKQTPRFMKIIDAWEFPVSEMTFIGVDDAKVCPIAEYEGLNIQRVPTFIFYRNNIEAGRIIENPVTSLEQDMVNILK